MQPPEDHNMLSVMAEAADGAQGLKEDWLLDYAAEAEGYRLQLLSAQDFINKTWDTRQ